MESGPMIYTIDVTKVFHTLCSVLSPQYQPGLEEISWDIESNSCIFESSHIAPSWNGFSSEWNWFSWAKELLDKNHWVPGTACWAERALSPKHHLSCHLAVSSSLVSHVCPRVWPEGRCISLAHNSVELGKKWCLGLNQVSIQISS